MLKSKFSKMAVFGLSAVLACGCLALAACGGSSSDTDADTDTTAEEEQASYTLVNDGVLTVATSPDYKPMEYQEGDEIMGFDIALIKEIGSRLGLEVDVQNQAFDSLVTQVAGGSSFDCSISCITITDERAEEVLFSDPYYDSNQAVLVLADSEYESVDDLNGAPIGAQSGTSGEEWVKENLTESDYTPFQETTDGLAALRTGTIEAFVYDEPVATNHVADEYDDCKILEVIPTGEQYGIIVNKDNQALCDAINEALQEIVDDGTFDELKTEWIG